MIERISSQKERRGLEYKFGLAEFLTIVRRIDDRAKYV